MNKANVYKGLKTFFYLAGFPLMLLMMFFTMMPMFNVEVMGDYARNWIIIFVTIWVAFEIVRFVLNKFVGSKSDAHHKIVVVATAIIAILAILLPPVIYDAVQRPKYEAAQKEIAVGAEVKNYDSVAGWHRDFSKKYHSEVYYLIDEHYDFMKMYDLQHTYSEWYDNADKKHDLGYKYGSFEWAKKLVEEKTEAFKNLPAAQEKLNKLNKLYPEQLKALADAQAAYDENKSKENKIALDEAKAAVAETKDGIFALQGESIDITAVKNKIVDVLWDVVLYIKDHPDQAIPNGLHFDITGDYDWMNLLSMLLKAVVGEDKVVNKEMIAGLIPNTFYTGGGNKTNIYYYKNQINGSSNIFGMLNGSIDILGMVTGSSDLSLVAASELNFKMNNYPQALAAGAVKYAAFIGVGLVVLSLFLTDYFSKKEKDCKNNAEGGNEND